LSRNEYSPPSVKKTPSKIDTPEEAKENLKEARRLYIKTLIERNLPIPVPKNSFKEPYETSANAGEIKVDQITTAISQPPFDITKVEIPLKVTTTQL